MTNDLRRCAVSSITSWASCRIVRGTPDGVPRSHVPPSGLQDMRSEMDAGTRLSRLIAPHTLATVSTPSHWSRKPNPEMSVGIMPASPNAMAQKSHGRSSPTKVPHMTLRRAFSQPSQVGGVWVSFCQPMGPYDSRGCQPRGSYDSCGLWSKFRSPVDLPQSCFNLTLRFLFDWGNQ